MTVDITRADIRAADPAAELAGLRSGKSSHALIDAIPSGGAVINHVAMHCLVPQLPFGGVGASGMGAYHGRWGFEALSHRRAVLAKPARPDPALVYPPYSDRALKIMRKLF
jgi:aldehyde dehydrogenase (NAD+)